MLSYLSVICNNEFSDVTIAALEKSRAVFPLPVIYICPPNCSVPTHLGYKVIHLDIDYKDYSEWMIKELHNYIDVAHVITIQYDSCVINKDFWSDVYLSYDYIGVTGWATEDLVLGAMNTRDKLLLLTILRQIIKS